MVSLAPELRSARSVLAVQVPPGTSPSEGTAAAALAAAKPWTALRLWIRVQADAFAFDPVGYLQAVAWRARGLRLRSRNRIAGLAGRSPSAYDFWIACREPKIVRPRTDRRQELAQIVPVIDCRATSQGLQETISSIPGDVRPVVIGDAAVAGAHRIDRIADLARVLEDSEAWLCPLTSGDRLAAGALDAYAAISARNAGCVIVYSDDDLVDEEGKRRQPHFKPQWNPELFEHHDFITGASIIKVDRDELGDLPEECWAQALVARAIIGGQAPVHAPYVLHHRIRRPDPIVPQPAAVELGADAPWVTVIIPTRNRADLLRNCIAGLGRTDYPKLDVIVVDNGSDEAETVAYLRELRETGVAVQRMEGPFNYSALNNRAAATARGELLCFLNNDIEILEPHWLGLLVRQAVRRDIGGVGARLLYPDGTVQHAGVFTGIGGGAAHGHRFTRADECGYFERARLPQRVSAVTGACLVVAREKFAAVGGFDEDSFPVAFNDIDLCLKLNARGWQAFYEPRATLIHHESKTRGSDGARANRARFAKELAALKRKWRTDKEPDPFHHPHLSPFCEQFLIAV